MQKENEGVCIIYKKMEPMQKEERLEGTVKAVVAENGKIKYAYIAVGKKDYPVTEGSVQRMENAGEILVKGNKVTFTVYHGKKDYANDVQPLVQKTKVKKPNLLDISGLSPEVQAFVDMCKEKYDVDLRRSILTTLNQEGYVELAKEEYIAAYLKGMSWRCRGLEVDEKLVVELIEHYWKLKKQG